MIERGFWQHRPTGRVGAVEMDDGTPVRCAGPLHARDVDPMLLRYLDYSATYLGIVQAEWSSYVQYDLCPACGLVIRRGAAAAANGAEGRVHLDRSLKPPAIDGNSLGAAVLVEALWQCSARLRRRSRALRQSSDRLQARCRAARSTHAVPPVT